MRRLLAAALAAIAIVIVIAGPSAAQDGPDSVVTGDKSFDMRVLAEGLASPWEITWGPDDFLWVTERTAGRVVRIAPLNGRVVEAVTIDEVSAPGGQDGLLGMALDPDLLKGRGRDYVYVGYTYVDEARGPDETVKAPASPYRFLYGKIVRFTYEGATGHLVDPVTLIDGLPAGSDHNSGRLKFGPDGKLYYTIGDGGKNQLANYCIPNEAQRLPTAEEVAAKDWIAYQGKSLRLDPDGSIPDDNPVIDRVKSHVFTYGHRNMQGIDFAPDGTLYASEQGPKTDDEINILKPGRNYGWPHVAGYRDDMAYEYARWADASTPCPQLGFSDMRIHPSVPREVESSWTEDFEPPIATLFTVPSDWNFRDPGCGRMAYICWPTVAASSIEVYAPTRGPGIPGWENSLLVTTLKRGSLYRIPLAADGRTLAGPIERYFQTENRYRDTAVSPDGATVFVATDNGGPVDALAGGTTTNLHDRGAILAFRYRDAP